MRRNNSRRRLTIRWTIAVILSIGMMGGAAKSLQKPKREAIPQKVQLGPGMSPLVPGLIQIGAQTDFFLKLADRIEISSQQRAAIEEILYGVQTDAVQKQADLNVARAELQRLLSREDIDLTKVRAKLEEMAAIDTDIQMLEFESILKVIKTLTHEQHLRIIGLAREMSGFSIKPQVQ